MAVPSCMSDYILRRISRVLPCVRTVDDHYDDDSNHNSNNGDGDDARDSSRDPRLRADAHGGRPAPPEGDDSVADARGPLRGASPSMSPSSSPLGSPSPSLGPSSATFSPPPSPRCVSVPDAVACRDDQQKHLAQGCLSRRRNSGDFIMLGCAHV